MLDFFTTKGNMYMKKFTFVTIIFYLYNAELAKSIFVINLVRHPINILTCPNYEMQKIIRKLELQHLKPKQTELNFYVSSNEEH